MNEAASESIPVQRQQRFRELRVFLKLVLKNPLSLTGTAIIVFFVVMALVGPFIVPYPRQAEGVPDIANQLRPPDWQHWFGTDELGRDLLSRIVFGARISLMTSATVVSVAIILGMPLGAVAGYYGERLGAVIMRVTDMFLAFPPLLLALVVAATLGGAC